MVLNQNSNNGLDFHKILNVSQRHERGPLGPAKHRGESLSDKGRATETHNIGRERMEGGVDPSHAWICITQPRVYAADLMMGGGESVHLTELKASICTHTLSARMWVKALPSCSNACDIDAEVFHDIFLDRSGTAPTSLIVALLDYSWCRRRVRCRTHMTDHLLNYDGKTVPLKARTDTAHSALLIYLSTPNIQSTDASEVYS